MAADFVSQVGDINTANRLADAYRRVAGGPFDSVKELASASSAARAEVMATRPRPLKDWSKALKAFTDEFRNAQFKDAEQAKQFLRTLSDGLRVTPTVPNRLSILTAPR